MKYGCCIEVPAQPSSGIGFDVIEQLAGMGYDYIEFPLVQVMELPEKEFTALEKHLKHINVNSEALNVFFPGRIRLTGEHVQWEEIEAYAHSAIGRAARLGARIIVLGSARSRNIPEGFPRAQAWEQLIQVVQRLDPIAKAYGITIALEPLNKKESNILNTVEEALALVRQAERLNIQLLVDYYHLSLEEEPLENVFQAGSAIWHVHFARVEGRSFPTRMDEGYQAFFDTLKDCGYDKRVSIEAVTRDILVDAPQALQVLRRLGG